VTRVQLVGGAVGVVIAAVSISEGPAMAGALRLAGYPVACAAIVRWVPIVRERNRRWLVAHELAMAGIAAGWALVPSWRGAIVNGAWGVIALVWWLSNPRPT
jgi:hypothetical protein